LKRLFSILFLLIFLFNIGGYYLVFWGLRSQARADLLQRLDAEKYAVDELIVLTIPISLPYPVYESGYQRVNGQFEYEGHFYHLVKQRLDNDTLFMVCIKDVQEKKLITAMYAYSDMANSLPSSAKRTIELLGKLFKDFTIDTISIIRHSPWSLNIGFHNPTFSLTTEYYPVFSPPPDFKS